MIKILKTGKHTLAFALTAALLLGSGVSAGVALAEGMSTELQREDGLSGAYDGEPSEVIGLKGRASFETRDDASGRDIRYVTQSANRRVLAIGNSETYKDAASGLYLLNGVYYAYAYDDSGMAVLSGQVTFANGQTADPVTGLYSVDGKNYPDLLSTLDNRQYVTAGSEAVYVGTYADWETMKTALAVKDTDGNICYYRYNDRYFKAVNQYKYIADGQLAFYADASCEMLINACHAGYYWNRINTQEKLVTPDNKVIFVGYEVEEKDKILKGDFLTAEGNLICRSNSYTSDQALLPGDESFIRVRAIYYTQDKTVDATTGKTSYTYHTYKTGHWSYYQAYTNRMEAAREVPALTVSAVLENDSIKVSWNRYEQAESYYGQYIMSNVPLSVSSANWSTYYNSSCDEINALAAQNPNFKLTSGSFSTSKTSELFDCETEYQYYYFVVCVDRLLSKDAGAYINNNLVSNVAAVTAVTADYVPQVSSLKANKDTNGSIVLTWKPVDADMVIYAYEYAAFPAYYNYEALDAYGVFSGPDGGTYTKALAAVLAESEPGAKKLVDEKVKSWTVDGGDGECIISNLEYGKKYYFLAHTIDTSSSNAEKPPIYVIDNIAFTKYNAMSPASDMTSASMKLSKPDVATISGKKSIKLNFSGYGTGFEIYKKVGKKYKKLSVTTDNFYLDEELKEKTTYTYKVRCYYYDRDSKRKAYSGYTVVSATTGTVNNIMLSAVKKTAKSVKLTWTKVSGAEKYEIYRSNEVSGDPSKRYKKNSKGNYADYLLNNKYTLVKTIKKAATTSYTNKGLTAGEDYSYVILAYYKNGKKDAFVTDSVYVSMEAETPRNVRTVNRGSSIKVSWDQDATAKSYMVSYRIYDSEGNAVSNTDTVKTTKKRSYTIKNLGKGQYAAVKVRAIGKNGNYSGWSQVAQGISLAGAKGISVAFGSEENEAGEGQNSVLIQWKKVPGAKYYKVYRSTRKPAYYADTKMYAASGTLISKESNDDEVNDNVLYSEYCDIPGSITSSVALDFARLDFGVDYYYTVVAYGENGTKLASYADYGDNIVYGSGSFGKVNYNIKLNADVKSKKKKVTVKWNQIFAATKYVIYRADSKKGEYKKIGTVKKPKSFFKDMVFTDKKVKKGKTYYYKVVAIGTTSLKSTFRQESTPKKIKVK